MDFTIETINQAIDRLIIRQTIKSARQSAVAILNESRDLDWIYNNQASPWRVKEHFTEDTYRPTGGLKTEQHYTMHRDVKPNVQTWVKETHSEVRRQAGWTPVKARRYVEYDLVDFKSRQVLKEQTIPALKRWCAKQVNVLIGESE